MKLEPYLLVALATATFAGGTVVGRGSHQELEQARQEQSEHRMMERTMSMDGMMTRCRDHCEQTSRSIDRMVARMKEAGASNDPAKMRQALDQAEAPLEEMRKHMQMCTTAMETMQKMHRDEAPR